MATSSGMFLRRATEWSAIELHSVDITNRVEMLLSWKAEVAVTRCNHSPEPNYRAANWVPRSCNTRTVSLVS